MAARAKGWVHLEIWRSRDSQIDGRRVNRRGISSMPRDGLLTKKAAPGTQRRSQTSRKKPSSLLFGLHSAETRSQGFA